MEKSLKSIASALQDMGIVLTEQMEKQFLTYYDLLIEWNEKINLTAITDFEEVLIKHFLDSLSIVKAVSAEKLAKGNIRIADIGTGAGFPGIPIKIAFPECDLVLVDSLNKRIRFLDTVIETLGLNRIEAVHGRSEELGRKEDYRDGFDLVVSRAVANLSVLTEYCLPFVKPQGLFVSYKSRQTSEELEGAKRAINLVKGKVDRVETFTLQGTDYERSLVLIKKTAPTPKKYPRRAGTPAKEPL